ncbi:MAG TPA: DUF4080 domain-containing protein [Planctomycetaceae bacterium]|nr:DUF4080 domain-containing protein [Planctomycetaceae bacterium]
MADIVLSTLNARYSHSSFGLRYLLANMGDLRDRTTLLEFTINDNTVDMLSAILEQSPQIVGFGVYIWNVEQTTRLIADLKRVRPQVIVVLGGPEVSYETEQQDIVALADFVITGEGEVAFRELCERLLASSGSILNANAPPKIIHAPVPQLDQIRTPYGLYTDEDIANRVIYVEVSRGCPFTCEFCLSALDIPVRLFDVDQFLTAMQTLFERGARQFKFVDRTFNLNLRVSRKILQFFLDRCEPGLFLHFEMIPDRLPESLRELIVQFPPGVLQFEVGVQTFNDEVSGLISRPQDNEKLEDNFRFLRDFSGVHIHADLIVGLPGESLDSFGRGFDRLFALRPQEIQVGILKRLKGTPIVRHDHEWQMVYSPSPPFEILSNRLLDFDKLHRLRRFARYWDLIGNSGNFPATLRLLIDEQSSAFKRLLQLSDWLYEKEQRRHGISLIRLFERLFEFLTLELRQSEQIVAETLWSDYTRGGRRDRPAFLRRFELPVAPPRPMTAQGIPVRQGRHQERD